MMQSFNIELPESDSSLNNRIPQKICFKRWHFSQHFIGKRMLLETTHHMRTLADKSPIVFWSHKLKNGRLKKRRYCKLTAAQMAYLSNLNICLSRYEHQNRSIFLAASILVNLQREDLPILSFNLTFYVAWNLFLYISTISFNMSQKLTVNPEELR